MDATQSEGVLLGMYFTRQNWDVRPVFLAKGQTNILRFRSPQIANNRQLFNSLFELDAVLKSSELGALSASGQYNGQLWVRRRYFNNLLSEAGSAKNDIAKLDLNLFLRRTLQTLRLMHLKGFVHGHVSSQNMGIEERAGKLNLELVDFLFLATDQERLSALPSSGSMGIAPEVLEGKQISAAADIYGLALVLRGLSKVISGFALSPIQEKLLDESCSKDPAQRPDALQLQNAFFPEEALLGGGSAAVTAPISKRDGLSRGKIITASPPPKSASSPVFLPPVEDLKPQTERLDFQETAEIPAEAVAAISRAPKASAAPPAAAPGSIVRGNFGSLIFFLFLVLVFLWQQGLIGQRAERRGGFDSERAWSSNQPSQMAKVAESALLDDDEDARAAIVDDALAGNSRPQTHPKLIKIAFNPLWEKELTAQDRKLVLYLATADLLNSEPKDLPRLSTAHPAIALSLAALAPLDSPPKTLQTVPIDRLASLPDPFGTSFASLGKSGVGNLGEGPALALSHILFADASMDIVLAFFAAAKSDASQFGRLEALLNISAANAEVSNLAIEYLSQTSGILGQALGWFGAEPGLSLWQKATSLAKLNIVSGRMPPEKLSFEQYADLLQFPLEPIRKEAEQALGSGAAAQELSPYVSFLASKNNNLSRFQTVSLLLALTAPAEKRDAYISTWFKSNPKPESVLSLLLLGRTAERDSTMNLEAARYLAHSTWSAGTPELKLLMGHPEVLARALAVAKLNPAKPEERSLLETMATVEPTQRIREQIMQRLNSSRQLE